MPTTAPPLAGIEPPEKPLPALRLLRMVVENPIKAWPQAIYRQHVYRSSVLGHDTIYVMAPDLIRTVLLEEADNFEKGEVVRRSRVRRWEMQSLSQMDRDGVGSVARSRPFFARSGFESSCLQ